MQRGRDGKTIPITPLVDLVPEAEVLERIKVL